MLLKVIEFFDNTNQTLVQRIPPHSSGEIPMGSQLIVQQNQEAVFFRNGEACDVLGPGRHTLNTETIPILTRLLTIPWERSPFTAHVFFVSRQTFLDQRWGTRQPVAVRDPEFGMVRLRGFGKFAFRAVDSALLVNTLIGSQGKMTTEDVTSYLRDVIVTRLTDLLATLQISLLDLPSKLDELSAAARTQISADFQKYGLELTDFIINSLTPPEEVQQAIDARSGMAVVGDLRSYTQYQAGASLRELAKSGGGGGLGMGVGLNLPWLMQPGAAGGQPAPGIPAAGGVPASGGGSAKPQPLDVRQLVRQVAQGAGWQLTEAADNWQLTVQLGPLRRQIVHVHFDRQDDDGYEVLHFATLCGPAVADQAMNFLRYNARLVHGAFSVRDTPSGPMVTLESNLLAETVDPLEITRSVAAIAWQADRIEQQLLTTDSL